MHLREIELIKYGMALADVCLDLDRELFTYNEKELDIHYSIERLFELCTKAEIEQDKNQMIRIGNIISTFPQGMIEMVGSYDENYDVYF